MNAEQKRLASRQKDLWKKWGPYLSERQWGTVREDYSEYGDAWNYFPHDHARSRVYRWGEDGIAGISDEMQRICFAITLWNGKDPILKERLFGLTGYEGNHSEDVKELYYYLDNTPTHSYMKHLYKYSQNEYPYADLVRINRNRTKFEPEFEISDTGIFNDNKYFDVFAEYAKNTEEDIFIRITIHNRSVDSAGITLLPTLFLRNLWSFGLINYKPSIQLQGRNIAGIYDKGMGNYYFYFETPQVTLFTENETNLERLYGIPNKTPFVKDAFHRAVIHNQYDFLKGKNEGTKFAPLYHFNIDGNSRAEVKLRLSKQLIQGDPFNNNSDELFSQRIKEADEFYDNISLTENEDEKNIQRQAFAGMLWNKQFFYIDIPSWLDGDKNQPAPPPQRKFGRNSQWRTLNNQDIISMPDKWEYPWYAAWDLAFHCVPLAMIDAEFAKSQLILFLREWYMHPNGQLPAYEWAFSDVNPPVHAWSCLKVYKIEKQQTGAGDISFLKRAFQKLLINFTWWVNRKDHKGNNIFEGGFLGLDNVGIFDRSSAIPGGGILEQVDGTSWMAMYCLNMLEMAIEIAQYDKTYEDVTTKFFEHFVYIAESLNRMSMDWTSAWDEESGFFYDILSLPSGKYIPLKIRSIVGLTSLFAVLVLKKEMLTSLPDFYTRLKWFRRYHQGNKGHFVIGELEDEQGILLSLVPKSRLEKLLKALMNEKEFLSSGGIRSLSKVHEIPYSINIDGQDFGLNYQPAESNTSLFGGNSNWRGPVWFPINYLLILSLETFASYFGENCHVEFPSGSGHTIELNEAALEISERLISIFKKGSDGNRPVNNKDNNYRTDPYFKDLILFYEYFHGDSSRGAGASHQTGWTGLVAELINRTALSRKQHDRNKER